MLADAASASLAMSKERTFCWMSARRVATIRAVKEAAGSIPIVMAVIDDPVGHGFAQSLAHPGGNLTGLSNLGEGLVGKRIEMLLEAVPDPGCVAVLHDHVDQADGPLYWQEVFAAARTLHTVLKPIAVRRADELPAAFAAGRSYRHS
jgi:putative tryptophan/tyrosine transport system substrate-binding protein